MAQDYTTIRVTEAAKAAAEDSKREDETWNEYIQRCTDNPPAVREFVDATDMDTSGSSVDTDALAREVSRRIDYAAIATQTADEVEERLR